MSPARTISERAAERACIFPLRYPTGVHALPPAVYDAVAAAVMNDHRSNAEASRIFGLSDSAVSRFLRSNGLRRTDPSETMRAAVEARQWRSKRTRPLTRGQVCYALGYEPYAL